MSFTALTNEYQSHIRRKIMWILLALVILIILAAAAVCIGVADLTPARLAVTWLPLSERYLDVLPLTPKEENVLLLLRLPRVAAAVIAGAGLGLAGTGMQAITGNQMASPFTTGLSGAAALGAAAVIIFSGIPVYFQKTAMVTAAFLMALICAVFVYGLSNLKGLGAETLVLTGIALNYFFSALNSTMQFIANEQQLPAIVHWTFGSLTAVGWSDIAVMTVILFITIPIVLQGRPDHTGRGARRLPPGCRAQDAQHPCGAGHSQGRTEAVAARNEAGEFAKTAESAASAAADAANSANQAAQQAGQHATATRQDRQAVGEMKDHRMSPLRETTPQTAFCSVEARCRASVRDVPP